jgi:hypothetical protein
MQLCVNYSPCIHDRRRSPLLRSTGPVLLIKRAVCGAAWLAAIWPPSQPWRAHPRRRSCFEGFATRVSGLERNSRRDIQGHRTRCTTTLKVTMSPRGRGHSARLHPTSDPEPADSRPVSTSALTHEHHSSAHSSSDDRRDRLREPGSAGPKRTCSYSTLIQPHSRLAACRQTKR